MGDFFWGFSFIGPLFLFILSVESSCEISKISLTS